MGLTGKETVVWRWRDGTWAAVPLAGSTGHPGSFGNPSGSTCAVVPLGDRTVAILADDAGTRAWWSRDETTWIGGETVSPAHSSNPFHVAGIGSTLVLAHLESEATGGGIVTVVRTGAVP